eukprot:m.22608 g.22608  ORF g.22608 m.22608 type:complete len:1508 (+) comp8402_c0_seq1:777-5300(+)
MATKQGQGRSEAAKRITERLLATHATFGSSASMTSSSGGSRVRLITKPKKKKKEDDMLALLMAERQSSNSFQCYAPNCPCKDGPSGDKKTWPYCKCYSPRCQQEHRQSYWKHPKVIALLVRASICTRLRQKERIEPYSSFVPRSLHDYLIQLNANATQEIPFGALRQGAVLFADASGFTKLTESLSAAPNGAERLCEILSKYFTILVNIIHEHGGDIVKFAGDALLVIWFVGDAAHTMQDAVRLAAMCSNKIHSRLHNYEAVTIGDEKFYLSLHMGLACGELTCLHVGGVFNRWEYVVDGTPMSEIAIAEPLAEPGETVMSSTCLQFLGPQEAKVTQIKELEMIAAKMNRKRKAKKYEPITHDRFVRLDEINTPLAPTGFPPSKLTTKHIKLLRRYIPAAIQPNLRAGHSGHLAEMRTVSVLFAQYEGINLSAKDSQSGCAKAIDEGQKLMLHVQQAIYTWEGSINKFIIDDKGLLVLCVFGLPPMKHPDDGKRATAAARLLVDGSRSLGEHVHCSIGVATGDVFAGVVGSQSRREYTVMGRVVNLAARLMQSAGQDQVLVDETTMEKGIQFFDFAQDTKQMKGIGDVNVYAPFAIKQCKPSKKSDLQVEARQEEIERLRAIVSTVQGGATIVITGERGSGKTVVVEQVEKMGKEANFVVVSGNNKSKVVKGPANTSNARSGHNNVDFTAWKTIVSAIVDHATQLTGKSAQEWVIESLGKENREHAPLLDQIVPTLCLSRGFDSTNGDIHVPRARAGTMATPHWRLSLQQKIGRLKDMMKRLIVEFAKMSDLMIVLHLQTGTSRLAHDPESWGLANAISRLCNSRSVDDKRLVFCIATRSRVYNSPIELEEVIESVRANHTLVQLKPLTAEASLKYLRLTLKVADLFPIPDSVVTYFEAMAAGNPKHIEELSQQLLDEGAISIDEQGRLNVLVDDLATIPLPPKMMGYVASILDGFQVRHQLITKIASTCDFFTESILQSIIPYQEEGYHLPHVIQDLVEAGIFYTIHHPDIPDEVLAWDPGTTVCYAFCSKLLQQEANKLLLSADRSELEQSRNKATLLQAARNIIQIQAKTQHWIKKLSKAAKKGKRVRSLTLPESDMREQGFSNMMKNLVGQVKDKPSPQLASMCASKSSLSQSLNAAGYNAMSATAPSPASSPLTSPLSSALPSRCATPGSPPTSGLSRSRAPASSASMALSQSSTMPTAESDADDVFALDGVPSPVPEEASSDESSSDPSCSSQVPVVERHFVTQETIKRKALEPGGFRRSSIRKSCERPSSRARARRRSSEILVAPFERSGSLELGRTKDPETQVVHPLFETEPEVVQCSECGQSCVPQEDGQQVCTDCRVEDEEEKESGFSRHERFRRRSTRRLTSFKIKEEACDMDRSLSVSSSHGSTRSHTQSPSTRNSVGQDVQKASRQSVCDLSRQRTSSVPSTSALQMTRLGVGIGAEYNAPSSQRYRSHTMNGVSHSLLTRSQKHEVAPEHAQRVLRDFRSKRVDSSSTGEYDV